jgi:hypothetical protein
MTGDAYSGGGGGLGMTTIRRRGTIREDDQRGGFGLGTTSEGFPPPRGRDRTRNDSQGRQASTAQCAEPVLNSVTTSTGHEEMATVRDDRQLHLGQEPTWLVSR